MMEAMEYRYRVVDDEAGVSAAREIRVAVFVEEQGIPRHLELDEIDAHATHVLALTAAESGTPVGTGRVHAEGDVAVIARIAVLPSHRGRGIGVRIVTMLEDIARREGRSAAELSPHYYLEDFYDRLGYRRIPGEESVAGHRLIRMRKGLA
jgi:predicted GNAT family N-acyltransferase